MNPNLYKHDEGRLLPEPLHRRVPGWLVTLAGLGLCYGAHLMMMDADTARMKEALVQTAQRTSVLATGALRSAGQPGQAKQRMDTFVSPFLGGDENFVISLKDAAAPTAAVWTFPNDKAQPYVGEPVLGETQRVLGLGRQWDLTVQPTEAWVMAQGSTLNWMIPGIGALIACIVGWVHGANRHGTRIVERVVEKEVRVEVPVPATEAKAQEKEPATKPAAPKLTGVAAFAAATSGDWEKGLTPDKAAQVERDLDLEEKSKTQERYRMFIERSPEAIWRIEFEPAMPLTLSAHEQMTFIHTRGVIAEANDAMARLFDYDAASHITGKTLSYIFPLLAGTGGAMIESWIQANFQITNSHSASRGRNGRIRWFNNNVTGIIEDGKLVRIWTVQHDVTEAHELEEEKKKIERRLLEAQKMESLGLLAGGVAGDFSQLLTSIVDNVALAKSGVARGSSADLCLMEIQRASEKAAGMCQQMQAYSGKGRYAIEPLNLNSMLVNSTELITTTVAKNVDVQMDLNDNVATVVGDAGQMQQAVLNLVQNAAEAIGERNGTILIRTALVNADPSTFMDAQLQPDGIEGSYVRLDIQDDGCGMSPETLTNMFDPFFTTKTDGRGLGLAAVYGIVRAARGAIKVQTYLGHGTLVSIYLPVGAVNETALHDADAAKVWEGSGMIMVVDDEAPVRVVACRILNKLGFQTEEAENGRRAVEIYSQDPQRYTAILLDYMMPQQDGKATLEQMQRINPNVKAVIMSGYSAQDIMSRLGPGFDARFLKKPFRTDVLRAVLKNLIEGVPQTEEPSPQQRAA